MKPISVTSIQGNYKIWTGAGLLSRTGALLVAVGFRGKVMMVTQSGIPEGYRRAVSRSLAGRGLKVLFHILPDGETAKSEKQLFELYGNLSANGFERRDGILALGGGVAGDLAGFAAATYLRGVPFANIPTTLLAQVDSSIGGKTGINLPEGKNLVGAFYPPRLVIADVETLETLPKRELRAALGEVIKYGVIKAPSLFRLLETRAEEILKGDPKLLGRIVHASAVIKAGVVSRDEHETRGERMILNFGHTFGHGFEQALGYRKLLHGEAVGAGMACASALAVELGVFTRPGHARLLAMLRVYGLPDHVGSFGLRLCDVMEAMGRDKKKWAGKIRFVLPSAIGRVVVREGVPEKLVEKILLERGVSR